MGTKLPPFSGSATPHEKSWIRPCIARPWDILNGDEISSIFSDSRCPLMLSLFLACHCARDPLLHHVIIYIKWPWHYLSLHNSHPNYLSGVAQWITHLSEEQKVDGSPLTLGKILIQFFGEKKNNRGGTSSAQTPLKLKKTRIDLCTWHREKLDLDFGAKFKAWLIAFHKEMAYFSPWCKLP